MFSRAVNGDIQGDIQVSPPDSNHEEDWVISAYLSPTGSLSKVVETTGPAYLVDDMPMDVSYYVLGMPKLGSVWSPYLSVQVGDKCFPTNPETVPYIFKATVVTGRVGNVEPSWPTEYLQTVVDGGVTWTNIGQMLRPSLIGPVYAVASPN